MHRGSLQKGKMLHSNRITEVGRDFWGSSGRTALLSFSCILVTFLQFYTVSCGKIIIICSIIICYYFIWIFVVLFLFLFSYFTFLFTDYFFWTAEPVKFSRFISWYPRVSEKMEKKLCSLVVTSVFLLSKIHVFF